MKIKVTQYLYNAIAGLVILGLGMAIKPIPAGIRPTHTRFDGENPS
jgi:hypothetical protein